MSKSDSNTSFSFGGPSKHSGSIFGGPSQQSGLLFGAPSQQSGSIFGGPSQQSGLLFGAPSQQSGLLFGAPSQQSEKSPKKKLLRDNSAQTEEELLTKEFMAGLSELLRSGQYSDVVLNVKGKEFKAHRNILAAHSPVFAAMTVHETKEKATGVVNIEDSEPEIFADFLQFLYSGSKQILNSDNAVGIYILADKYQVTELSKACVTYMTNHLSLDTFCDVMALSLRYHEKELTEKAIEYFLENSIDIAENAKWLIFMKENLVAGNELFLKALKSKNRLQIDKNLLLK